jgi:arginyl-tRNA synthetase
METIIQLITKEIEEAFEKAGYDKKYGKVTVSNRPDLCEYQCNGAMAAAKEYKKAPLMIANHVVGLLSENDMFENIEGIAPGFINIKIAPSFLSDYLNEMMTTEDLGIQKEPTPKTIIVDYGGPNVAKPLHIGHIRAAIIGESVKRLVRLKGNKVIGDIHLGDWGYQMGLIINELEKRQPNLPYFDDNFTGEYPKEPPFTISELEEIYPTASKKAKEDEVYREESLKKTLLLQSYKPGYLAIWRHIMDVSLTDMRKIYDSMNIHFELWKGEADVQELIPNMVKLLKDENYAYYDKGALVVDVSEEDDKKEIPPCMILKSDGAGLYSTTDLATIIDREENYQPDKMIYVVDKRQELHFVQVFRVAKKAGFTSETTPLVHIGFGTMNGKDGKPFKTRSGGVMRLENLIEEINEEMLKKIMENRTVSPEEAKKTAEIIGLAALKYGDLSNQATKDYVFDMERFTSFEGNTGPYILYTIVRIKSILNRYLEEGGKIEDAKLLPATSDYEKRLMQEIAMFSEMVNGAYEDLGPHKVCAYIYDLANSFNKFYHETKILAEEDKAKKESYIKLLSLTKEVFEIGIDVLGFEAPDRM